MESRRFKSGSKEKMNGALIALIVMVVLMTWFLLVVRNEAAKLSKGKKKK